MPLLSEIANPKLPHINSPADLLSLQDMATKAQINRTDLQNMQEDQRARQAEIQIAKAPGAFDMQAGMYTPVGLNMLAGVSPRRAAEVQKMQLLTLQQLAQQRQAATQEKVNLGLIEKREQDQRDEVSRTLNETWANRYDLAKKAGASDDEAQRQAEQGFQEEFRLMDKQGKFPWAKEGEREAIMSQRRDINVIRSKLGRTQFMAERKVEDAEKKQDNMPLSEVGKVRADEKRHIISHSDAQKIIDKKEGNQGDAVPPSQSQLHGEDYLKSLKPAEQGLVKSIADGKIDPKSLSTRGGHRERILQQVVQYRPDYNQQDYGQADSAVKAFGTGKQGQSVRAFNVALEHLDTLQELGNALENKDLPLINSIANRWKTETGDDGPTSFNGAKQLVADEVVKAIVGSGGGVTDREEAAKTIRAASSPAQLVGIIDTYKHLFGGQIKGLEQQYKSQSKRDDFRERFLTDKGRAAAGKEAFDEPEVKRLEKKTKVSGHELEFDDPEKEKRYQQWKKANGR